MPFQPPVGKGIFPERLVPWLDSGFSKKNGEIGPGVQLPGHGLRCRAMNAMGPERDGILVEAPSCQGQARYLTRTVGSHAFISI